MKKQLLKKYGKEFVEKAERDEGGFVNERVKHKLSIRVSCQLGRGLISWLKMPDHLWLRR